MVTPPPNRERLRRVSYERRMQLWLAALALPPLGLAWALALALGARPLTLWTVLLAVAAIHSFLASIFFEQAIRPLQTLGNVLAALREDDFSFRARDAKRGDAMGDLAFEINALATTIQTQRVAALDALTLVERVLATMPSPVLAFDEQSHLRLHNAAAAQTFSLPALPLGLPAAGLGLSDLLLLADHAAFPPGATRWSVRRATFRLHGRPHTLLILTDVSVALRAEERTAFQRLIRVLSHEINNSLAPIQSIAGSLRTRLDKPADNAHDMARGLAIIEERAAALNRFLKAYQRLARLPTPVVRPVNFATFLPRVAMLETRVRVNVEAGPDVMPACDPDQVTQALINLLANAAEAAMENTGEAPHVRLGWHIMDQQVSISITDNGPGIASAANLFVPFYTTKPNGSGIGLALVQQIASAHGGFVHLQSNAAPAAGCTATLSLPLEPEHHAG